MLIKKSDNLKLSDFLITDPLSLPRLVRMTAPRWFE